MDPLPERHESPPQIRNLDTNFDETAKMIAEVEATPGSQWVERQGDDWKDVEHNSIANAKLWLQGADAKAGKGHFVIYGSGGVDRWFVYPDGSVVFYLNENSKSGTLESARRAAACGFPVEHALRKTR